VPGATEARRALLARARRHPGWLVVSVVAGTLAGLVAIPQARLLTAVLNGGFLLGRDLPALSGALVWLLAAVVFRAAAIYLSTSAGHRAGERVARDLRSEVTARLLGRGPAYLEHHASGKLSAEVLEGTGRIEPYVARFLPQAALTVIVPVLVALYVLHLDPISGVILLVTGPLVPLFLWLLGTLAEQRAQRQWRALSILSAQALDALQGLETLRLFGRATDHEQAMARGGERYRRTTLDVLKVAFLSGFALELLAMLGTAMVAVTVGLRLATGELSFSVALTTLLLAPEFYLPFRQLGAHHHASMEGVAAARDLLAHLAQEAPTPAAVAPEPAAGTPGRRGPPGHPADASTGRGAAAASTRQAPAGPQNAAGLRIALRRIHARYPGADHDALRGLDLELGPAGITALVGPTGAGKSSVARLLIGTLAARSGTLLADGAPVDPTTSDRWRQRLAFVPQRPHLFEGTVLDNLRLGDPVADRNTVVEAARRAEADAFIRALPQGYDTPLGENGLDLSGGERQRLAIARAFVRDAELVILDEITAHLDTRTEGALAHAVKRLSKRSTVLVIAHRLSTVRAADRIAVLVDGVVLETGRHAELTARGGWYARLTGAAGRTTVEAS
jgi:ATP-binding cassette, subfamily C, bacterial CydD